MRKRRGFTDRLAVALVVLLAALLAGGFVLAILSITHSYTGALACYTIAATPIGIGINIVLAGVVEKNKAENTGASEKSGEGIRYAEAVAAMRTDQNYP